MLATLAADPIAGLIDTAYVGRLGEQIIKQLGDSALETLGRAAT